MERRSYLKIGLGAGVAAGVAGGAIVGYDRIDDYRESPDDVDDGRAFRSLGEDVDPTGDDEEFLPVDFEQFDRPDDVYRVWSGDPSQFTFVDEPVVDGETALRCTIGRRESDGSNAAYWFPANGFGQPSEVRQRVLIRLDDDWTMDEGDVCRLWFAGLNTEAGVMGSGGRGRPSGIDGWSSMFALTDRENDDADAYNLAAYTYHMDQNGTSGEFEVIDAAVGPGEWFEFETHVAVNSVSDGEAQPDGEVRCALDGEPVYERTDFRWTTVEEQAIEYAGPVVRYGGSETAPRDLAIYYDRHELFAGGIPDIPPYAGHPHFEDPDRMDAYDGRLTLVYGIDPATYRVVVDDYVVHTDWSNVDGQQATYNDTVEIVTPEDHGTDEAVVEAEADPNTVDGYFYDGEVVSIESEPVPVELWIDGEQVEPIDHVSSFEE